MNTNQTALVACATRESSFAEQISKAASAIGKDFIAANELPSLLDQYHDRLSTCFVVHYGTAFDQNSIFNARKTLRDKTILVAVPPQNVQAVFEAANAGATGVFACDVPHDEVAACLTEAFESDSAARKTGQFTDRIYSELNEREKQILFHLMVGRQNKRVASILDISLRTVEAGRAELIRKLGVSSFAGLIALVAEVEHESQLSRRRLAR